MKRKLIYIAGPYRGSCPWETECHIRTAEEAGLDIARRSGDVPVIPHTMYRFFQDALPDLYWLDATLELLRTCDIMVVLPGWYESPGTKAEMAEADRVGILLYYYDQMQYSIPWDAYKDGS